MYENDVARWIRACMNEVKPQGIFRLRSAQALFFKARKGGVGS